uniref:Dynein light chain n=1 Tax=Ascaris lumbricoides TaxID=6252 RepID=A0A0M3HS38_ASCLU
MFATLDGAHIDVAVCCSWGALFSGDEPLSQAAAFTTAGQLRMRIVSDRCVVVVAASGPELCPHCALFCWHVSLRTGQSSIFMGLLTSASAKDVFGKARQEDADLREVPRKRTLKPD